MSSFKATVGDGYGPVFMIELCTVANPRWRRWITTHYPTASQAQARVDNLWTRGGKRTFRVVEYRRDTGAPEEYTP